MIFKLKIKSIDSISIKLYLLFLKSFFKRQKLNSFSFYSFPIKRKRITLLKSPHVNKKARSQFEMKLYTFLLTIKEIKNFNLIKYIIINKPKNLKLTLKCIGKANKKL